MFLVCPAHQQIAPEPAPVEADDDMFGTDDAATMPVVADEPDIDVLSPASSSGGGAVASMVQRVPAAFDFGGGDDSDDDDDDGNKLFGVEDKLITKEDVRSLSAPLRQRLVVQNTGQYRRESSFPPRLVSANESCCGITVISVARMSLG